MRVTPGSIRELNFEPGEINLGLASPGGVSNRTSKGVTGSGLISRTARLHRGVAASVTPLSQLPPQPHRGEARESASRSPRYGEMDQCSSAGAVVDHRPAVPAHETMIRGPSRGRRRVDGNGSNFQALPMKFQDHDEFSEFDHHAAPSRHKEKHR